MLTAESVFARLASTLVNEIEWIRDFFVPILNKQMTETSQEAKNPCVLISFKPQRSLSQWGRQLLGHAAFPWKGPGKAVWARRVPGPLDTTPPCICYHLTWPKQSEVLLFCSESEINHEGLSWHCHLVCKANLLTELTTTVLEMGCVDGSKHKWVTMSLSYLTHFICLQVVSMMWHVCQQLRLCVFLQFTVLISGCLSGCWQLL